MSSKTNCAIHFDSSDAFRYNKSVIIQIAQTSQTQQPKSDSIKDKTDVALIQIRTSRRLATQADSNKSKWDTRHCSFNWTNVPRVTAGNVCSHLPKRRTNSGVQELSLFMHHLKLISTMLTGYSKTLQTFAFHECFQYQYKVIHRQTGAQ